MGAYDGAEVGEHVGLFLLNISANKFVKNNVGLYKDDGLALLKISMVIRQLQTISQT